MLASIVFHLLHFTIRTIFPEYNDLKTTVDLPMAEIHDVYNMILAGFRVDAIQLLYGLYVSSLLSSSPRRPDVSDPGLRSESWRSRLDCIASVYGWIIFAGFPLSQSSLSHKNTDWLIAWRLPVGLLVLRIFNKYAP